MNTKNETGNQPTTPAPMKKASAPRKGKIVYVVGPKGGIGKSTVARLTIDGCIAAGRNVSIIQIDRAPTLPALYPALTTTILTPSAEELRLDLLSSVRVFEPLDQAVDTIIASDGVLVVDVGAGANTGALLHCCGRWLTTNSAPS